MKPITKVFLFFIVISFPVQLSSQQNEDFILGILLDARTQEPVPFATIRLKEKAVGVISNQDGGFRVPRRFLEMGELLEISCVGYQRRGLSLSDLELGVRNRILMVPEPILLDESVLYGRRKRPPSPRKIVRRALERIPQNYPTTPFSYVGYYRDYQMKGKEYINLNEALLKVMDMGFGTNDLNATKVQIFDYRANMDFERDTLADNPYNYATRNKIIKDAYLYEFGGNELNILRIHDAIRNFNVQTYSFIDIPEKGLIRNHSLSRKKDRLINGDRMFVISLDKSRPAIDPDQMHDGSKTARFTAEGTLYIAQSGYAIHKLEYRVFDTRGDNPNGTQSGTSGKLIFEVSLEYKEHQGKMYPNYISFHNIFTLQKAPFHITGISMDTELKYFEVSLNKKPIRFIDRTSENFDVRYKNSKVKLERIVPTSRGYRLYPAPQKFDVIAKELAALSPDSKSFSTDILQINISGIQDIEGNTLNAFYREEYHQFREFFTQQVEVNPNWDAPEDSLMKKDSPIFENQPIIKPDNFDRYWMNTPLISNE